ncbi:MAG: excinuclease ABC subunit UvrA [Lachnospiraceae bacterium]|nr:excinuclease ABC subunit UvrA [Lachnospiraceae bacterium]
MAVKMKKPDYWPALKEAEVLAQGQKKRDEKRRSLIHKEDCIRIMGAREHNLKNIDVTIPRNELVVLTGLSGSGKSSLAFDTIYAEGQRRYMESLSSYARQFLGQMEKPDVDQIEGLSPAISIDQKSTNRNPRSTVGTVTEIYDYFRLLYARIGIPHCPECGRVIEKQTVDQMVDRVRLLPEGTKILVLSPVVRGKKGRHEKVLERARRAGYVRVRVDGNPYDLTEEEIELDKNIKHSIEIIVDRLVVREGMDRRLADSLENALELAEGLAQIQVVGGELIQFSQNFACPDCGISIPEIEPRSFSFNNPFGACPSCAGIGYKMEFDPELMIPDKSKSINDGAIAVLGWQSCMKDGSWTNATLVGLARKFGFSLDTPWKDLPEKAKDILLNGSPEEFEIQYKSQSSVSKVAYRITFEGLMENTYRRYKETGERMRQEYEQFMRISPCKVCGGKRLKKESLAVTVGGRNIYDVTCLSVRDLLSFVKDLELTPQQQMIGEQILKEIRSRVSFLSNVGLDYLSLSRATATLSGGEAQRIRLATQIGSGLVGVCYILDEPSIGLHQRDNDKLLRTLKSLRDMWNTVIVVEHDEDTMRAADYIVDIGPGAGSHGGEVVACGTAEEIMSNPDSLTGQYLAGKRYIPVPAVRRKPSGWLTVRGAAMNNLKHIDVKIPLGVLCLVTGVSGSGKSSLVNEILYNQLARDLNRARTIAGPHDGIDGEEQLDKVINIDQSPIGRTPRSNPATYTGVFDIIRDLFAGTPDAKAKGYSKGRFSFNVKGGRCEACSGDGIIKIEMHFLPDVYVPCEVCGGKRYNRETLDVKYKGKSIYDVLDMTIEEAVGFFANVPAVRDKIQTLYDVGLGYVKLGQPSTELSGGEAQRIKLAAELSRRSTGKTIYILDEPTTGLHFEDVRKLTQILQKLVEGGNSVVVIEHNLDVIKTADYIIDMGPEGGDGGGTVVACGTPEEIAEAHWSYTGYYVNKMLEQGKRAETGENEASK